MSIMATTLPSVASRDIRSCEYYDKHIIKKLGIDSAKFDGIRRLASSATVQEEGMFAFHLPNNSWQVEGHRYSYWYYLNPK